MKDALAFLDLMVRKYEDISNTELSPNDPVFHTFASVSHVCDILSVYGDKEARERYAATAVRRSSLIAHSIAAGYIPKQIEPDLHEMTLTFTSATPTQMFINAGDKFRTEIQDNEYTIAEAVEETVIPVGTTEIKFIVQVGETVKELLGVASGAEMSFPLSGDYVYVDSLYLELQTNMGTEKWTKVDDFINSDAKDPHFVIDYGAANFNDVMKPNDLMLYLRCGNGTSGRLFPKDSQVTAVYVEVSPYHDTLALGAITTMVNPLPYVSSVKNTRIVKEKELAESIEVLRRNAIYSKSIGSSLLTKDDLERAVIVQSNGVISKAFAEGVITDKSNIYTMTVSGEDRSVLTPAYLASIVKLLEENYTRSLTDEYKLVLATQKTGNFEMDIIYQEWVAESSKTLIETNLTAFIKEQTSLLELGETYSPPDLFSQIMSLTSRGELFYGIQYMMFKLAPPVVGAKEELHFTDANFKYNRL